jgi:hypothetical protein
VVPVAVQVSEDGLYRAPVLTSPEPPKPPQTIISVPVQMAVCESRADGTFVPVSVAPHESVEGL